MSPTILISPVLPTDLPSITRAATSSFDNDILFASAFPQKLTPEQKEEHYQYRLRRMTKAVDNPSTHWFKAMDKESGEVVGVCAWIAPTDDDDDAEGAEEAGFGDRCDMPTFMSREFFEDFDVRMKGLKEEVGLEGRGDFWYLATMSVIPTYQGRGVGSQLLKHSLAEGVDKDGRESYLEASPAGANLYRRCGFEDRGVVEMMGGNYKIIAMLRPGQGQL